MKIPQSVNALLEKPMDRRDFLKHIAIGLLLASGASSIIRSLGQLSTTGKQVSAAGYGASVYGGKSLGV
ncbi:MAG: hypothetical protein WAW62_04135 [Candidatus Saccharimonas aalborgensis]